jgi:hypothetical protein
MTWPRLVLRLVAVGVAVVGVAVVIPAVGMWRLLVSTTLAEISAQLVGQDRMGGIL